MTKKYKVVPFIFNAGKFAFAVRLKIQGGLYLEEVAQIAGVSDTTVKAMASGLNYNPEMNTFLGICNALDLNALDYIELADS